MKLITTANKLEKEFLRLLQKYNEYYWATAWAGVNSEIFNELIKNKSKIKMLVIGTHFYQTHPDFIEQFIDNENVHFIQQPDGTFHSKLYLFFDNEESWELIVGSANFTNAAFSKNTEASILLSNNDENATEILENAKRLVTNNFDNSKTFDFKNHQIYSNLWKNHRPKIKSLSGQYGSKKRKPKPIHEVEIINKSWEEFIKQVRDEKSHGLNKRLRVIEIAQDLFKSKKQFLDMTDDERKFIAGIPNNLKINGAEDWGYFGSMKGAGIFKNRIIENDINISNALNQIPFSGQITKKHYTKFIEIFNKAFINTRLEEANNLSTATRLLAMKRPDTFICLDNKNRSALCKDFGIIQSDMNFENYWDDIIERIYDSDWWINPNPKNEIDFKVSEARAIFLDSLYYEE